MPAGDAPPERAALADEVLLADELVERPRTHPGRERLAFGRRLEQGLGSGADRTPRGWHVRDGSAGRRPARQCLDRAHPREMRDRPEDQQEADERSADESDPAHVASDIGVLLGRGDLEA